MVVMSPPEVDAPNTLGFIEPSFERGALMLKDAKDQVYRLSWNEGQGQDASAAKEAGENLSKDRRRALPAGPYRLVGYRLIKTDENDQRWDLSASHPKLRTLDIQQGEVEKVTIDETITMRHRISAKRFGLTVIGESPAGLTLYRDGKRIGIEFELVDAAGEVRQEGKLRYG